MGRPRHWEHGDGSVPVLLPDVNDLIEAKAHEITHEEYRLRHLRLIRFRTRVKVPPMGLTPGTLLTSTGVPVIEGDTLLCSCSVQKAREGRCHRTWVAALLMLSGWPIVLDKVTLTEEQARGILT